MAVGLGTALKHRIDIGFRRLLGERYVNFRQFEVPIASIPDAEREKTELHHAFYSNDGTLVNKWTHYLDVYDQYFHSWRGKSVRLLELGVSQGGSLKMWREYFGSSATIFGVDIDPKCAQFDGIYGAVRVGSQADSAFLRKVVDEMGGLDLVVDDGSHVASHQITSFEVLYDLLSDRGTYICEDTHTAYMPGFHEGGYRRQGSFIEYAKRIVDDMHHDFHQVKRSNKRRSRDTSGIAFYNSMVVFQKMPEAIPRNVKVGQKVDGMVVS